MNKITKDLKLIYLRFVKQSISIILILFLCLSGAVLPETHAQDLDPASIESELAKDILGAKKKSKEPAPKTQRKNIDEDGDLITFSARNISIKDAFATLARISNKSISVGSDIRDDETIAVIEIQDRPFEEAFFNLIDAAMVNYTSTGVNSYTVIKSGSANPIMIFGLGATSVDKSLPLPERTADLSYDNQDLATLLKDLANKYGIDIVLTVAPTERVSCRVRNVNIDSALKLVLSGTSYDYTKTGNEDETFVIYNRLNKNFTVGQISKMYTLMNLEAMDVQALLPVEVRANVRISNDQNAIIADGSTNDLKRIEEFISEIDKPLPQVELELKLIEFRKEASLEFKYLADRFKIGMLAQGTQFGPGVDTIKSVDADGKIIDVNTPNPVKAIAGADPGSFKHRPGGVTIFNFNPDFWKIFNKRVTYLEKHNLANVRAYPKLLSLSGRTAMINIDTDTNLVLGSASGGTQGASFAVQTQQLQRITAGTALSITPIVGTGGLITAKINIEVSDNSGKEQQNGVTIPGTTTRRRITADVQVRDGETVAIGGLVIDNGSLNKQGFPLITKMPILGTYLSNKIRSMTQSELIVLITPTIRNIPEEVTTPGEPSTTSSDKDTSKSKISKKPDDKAKSNDDIESQIESSLSPDEEGVITEGETTE